MCSVIDNEQCVSLAFDARHRVRAPCVDGKELAEDLVASACRIAQDFVEGASGVTDRASILEFDLDLLVGDSHAVAHLSEPSHAVETKMS